MSRAQADQIALAVDNLHKPIPGYMRHARDGYLPLDQPAARTPIRWPYYFATILSLCCVAFVICAYIWR